MVHNGYGIGYTTHGYMPHSHEDDESRLGTPNSKDSGFSLSSIAESTKSQDINIRAAMVHVISDLIQVNLTDASS